MTVSPQSERNVLLDVQGVESYYGTSQALFGMTFDVREREVVTLIGRNGMGKSTIVKTIMGMLRPRSGSIALRGADIASQAPHCVASAGIGLVPEGRRIFPQLTVRENLVATARLRGPHSEAWTLERVYALFPRLKERENKLGANLSGGEQQMLAIGRALMTNPRLLILDEATEGLAPLVRVEIWACLARLKAAGMSMIVIDKNIGPLLRIADRHNIVEKGKIVWSGDSAALRERGDLLKQYLGV
jgi:branched-chain amino acid transport system ATP-binding protein